MSEVRYVRQHDGVFVTMLPHERKVLTPFDPSETIGVQRAAFRAGNVRTETIRQWCVIHGLGRKVGGRYQVSHPALLMFLEGDGDALAAYHRGERLNSDRVRPYFERAAAEAVK